MIVPARWQERVDKESVPGARDLHKPGTTRATGNAMVPGADLAGLLERHVYCH
jgi:hypothetical protein